MAQFAVTAAGAAVGSLFGAPQVGWLVGSFIGSQLFAEKQQVEGPRLGDLQVQASTYGMGIPQVFGSMRLAGNVIWARPLIEKRRKQSAGKGGGQTVVSYEYFATFAVAFARGPVDAIRRVWADGKLLVDLSESAQQGKTYRYGERVYRLHLGTDTQVPDPVIEMHEGAGMRLLTVGSSISPSTSCRSRTSAIASPTSPPKWSRPRARSIRASSSTWRPRASTTGQGRVAARSRAAVHLQRLERLAAQDPPRHGRGRLPRPLGERSGHRCVVAAETGGRAVLVSSAIRSIRSSRTSSSRSTD
jgi:hypothetical protein